jgi:hypothetical protein
LEHGWQIEVLKCDLVRAVGIARTRSTLVRRRGVQERTIVLTGSAKGLYVRSESTSVSIDGQGCWTSPISCSGPTARRLIPKLTGPTVVLRYDGLRLFMNNTAISAREF